MNALISNLTAILLVIHAMIGCCHHHWHRDSECTACTVAEVTLCAAPCQCYDECCGSHDDSEQPSQPCNGELECHGICTYLPTQKTVIDVSTAEAAFDIAAAIPTLLDGRLAAALPWDLAHTLNKSPPPLRLHLLHQILLI